MELTNLTVEPGGVGAGVIVETVGIMVISGTIGELVGIGTVVFAETVLSISENERKISMNTHGNNLSLFKTE